uniref:Uncharacterized protein n=1 Tax=viral metagenome TaxID=1070528 RepID=A0A6H1ZRB3_9ZZZZ
MARFYGEIRGKARTSCTRVGQNYLNAHIRGWDHGVQVVCTYDKVEGEIIEVWTTGGSNDSRTKDLVWRSKERSTHGNTEA